MSTLSEFYITNGYTADKGTIHDYINGYYSQEFSDKRTTPINLLEIGIHHGDSIRLWLDWFQNRNIFAMDNTFRHLNLHLVDGATIMEIDGYNQNTPTRFEDEYFDYIIDDGPHTIDSQVVFIHLWYSKLKIGGKLIIEDIQDFDTIHLLENAASAYKSTYKVFDLRNNKGCKDDIIFELTRL